MKLHNMPTLKFKTNKIYHNEKLGNRNKNRINQNLHVKLLAELKKS